MKQDYKVEAVNQLAQEIRQSGFRVFIAKSGTYGFYTDATGSRVVCFQFDLGGFTFSGNYKTDNPRSSVTGWRLENDTYKNMFNQFPFQSALRGTIWWKYSTLEQHLSTYQISSQYTEV